MRVLKNQAPQHLGRHRAPEAWIPCYRAGWSIQEIAEYFFSSTYMVRLKLILAGEPIRGGHKNGIVDYAIAPRRDAAMKAEAEEQRRRMRLVGKHKHLINMNNEWDNIVARRGQQ